MKEPVTDAVEQRSLRLGPGLHVSVQIQCGLGVEGRGPGQSCSVL